MTTLATQLKRAETRAAIAEAKAREAAFRAQYDAISEDSRRSRRQPAIEIVSEEGQLKSWDRLKAVARGRDLYRNSAAVRGWMLQLVLNILGTHPKLMLHSGNEDWDKAAGEWFNSEWAPVCDGRGNRHLADLNAIILTSQFLCGDVLMLFDGAGLIPGGDGKLFLWDADQLPNLDPGEWSKKRKAVARQIGAPTEDLSQSDGIIYDAWGRTLAYVVSPKYGVPLASLDEVTILPAGPATLLYSPWRANQRRGVADILTVSNDMADLAEIKAALLARMKAQSYLALKVKKHDADTAAVGRQDGGTSETITPESPAKTGKRNYTQYEKLSRGAIEYLEPDEDVETLSLPGDIPDAEALANLVQIGAGFALGLTRLFSVGKADASYSASRAEGNLAEAYFSYAQKRTERYQLDWEARKSIAWAARTGALPAGPAGWERKLDWRGWPTLQPLDPNQEANAMRTRLACGATDYSQILGPDWRDKLTALGEQIKASRDAGFFAEPFQPKTTGGAAQ